MTFGDLTTNYLINSPKTWNFIPQNCIYGIGCKMIHFIVKPIITYTPTEGRGYKPRQRRRGVSRFLKCSHIFGLYYK